MTGGDSSDARARMAANLAAIEALRAEIDEEVASSSADDVKQQEEFEASARSGRLGVEWQRVQQRIDLGQTTLDDVLSGVDESNDARVLRTTAEKNLDTLHEKLLEDEESEDVDDDPLTQVNRMQSELAERLENLRLLGEANRGL